MSILRIIIEIDNKTIEIHEFDNTKQGLDPINRFHDFMRAINLWFNNNNYAKYFGIKK